MSFTPTDQFQQFVVDKFDGVNEKLDGIKQVNDTQNLRLDSIEKDRSLAKGFIIAVSGILGFVGGWIKDKLF